MREINKKKDFENLMIEENEQVLIPLKEYYSGSLLNYRINIIDDTGKLRSEDDLNLLVNISDSFKVVASEMLREDTYEYIDEPFPRTTLYLKEYIHKKLSLYMIDRQFNFVKYDVTEFSLEKLHKIYSV